MKKRAILFFCLIAFLFSLTGINTYAASLTNFDVSTNKTTIKPGDEITVKVNFGTKLGSYTLDFAYDNTIFDYVSTTGGEANDTKSKVRVAYYDSTGGSNPKESMSITFKAKSTIDTTKTAKISITAEGLANSDASEQYDDITQAIEKTITIEPEKTETKTEEQTKTNENKTTEIDKIAKTDETKKPSVLPKTGANMYLIAGIVIIILTGSLVFLSKKEK